jgi:glycosyltransferase involved in cell wall biosynthesis
MVRIAIVAWPCIHHGGAERWWYHVLDELKKSTEISYYVMISLSLHRGCLKCPEALQSSNIITIYLPSKGNPLLDLISWFKFLIKLIREKNIDLIVAGYQTPRIVLISFLAGAITKRRVFVMFHLPIGWLPYVRETKLSRISKIIIKLYGLLNRYGLSYFILCSPSVVYDLERNHLKVTRVCSVKGSAVIKPIEITYKPYNERDIGIVHLASISRAKGIYDVPLALRRVKERIPNFKAVIIGRISDDLEKEFREMLKSYGVEDNVELLGYVDEVKKFELLARSKVIIYPSYMDTFAIVVLEALSVGTPVVAYGIPAIRINYKTDAVIPVNIGDVNEIAEKAIKMLSDEQYWVKLSTEAIAYASTYSWNIIAKDFLKCIAKGLKDYEDPVYRS